MTSLVSPADAGWITALWNEAGPLAQERWPVKIPTHFDEAHIAATIDVALRPTPGHYIYTDPLRRGFFVCRPGNLPEKGVVGSELVIWILQPGLLPAEYRDVLNGLFADWLNDELGRAIYEWGFGSMPVSMSPGDRKYLDDWLTAGDLKVTEYDGPGGVKWRRYYGRVKDIMGNLPI